MASSPTTYVPSSQHAHPPWEHRSQRQHVTYTQAGRWIRAPIYSLSVYILEAAPQGLDFRYLGQ